MGLKTSATWAKGHLPLMSDHCPVYLPGSLCVRERETLFVGFTVIHQKVWTKKYVLQEARALLVFLPKFLKSVWAHGSPSVKISFFCIISSWPFSFPFPTDRLIFQSAPHWTKGDSSLPDPFLTVLSHWVGIISLTSLQSYYLLASYIPLKPVSRSPLQQLLTPKCLSAGMWMDYQWWREEGSEEFGNFLCPKKPAAGTTEADCFCPFCLRP